MSGPRILLWKNKIWEAYGSNLGDLAIITATVAALRREIPDATIVMISDDPAHTESLYPGVTAVRLGLCAYVREVRAADLVVVGGGTVFSDFSAMALPVNTSVAFLARWFRTPVVLYGVASGRMRWASRLLTRGTLKRVALCFLRDAESIAELKPLAPDLLELEVTGDVAFSLYSPESSLERDNRVVIAPRRLFHYNDTRLPYALRRRLRLLPAGYDAKLDSFKSLVAEVADHLVENHGCDVVFLPMYSAIGPSRGLSGFLKREFSSRDDQTSQEILERMAHKGQARVFLSDRPLEVLSLIASSRMLVGVPLHSLILAHVAETPMVGLAYQGKVSRFMCDSGMERFTIPVDSMDCPLELDEFISKVDACFARESEIREVLAEGNAAIRRTVDIPAERIARLLSEARTE